MIAVQTAILGAIEVGRSGGTLEEYIAQQRHDVDDLAIVAFAWSGHRFWNLMITSQAARFRSWSSKNSQTVVDIIMGIRNSYDDPGLRST